MELVVAVLKYGLVLALCVEAGAVAWALVRLARGGAREPGSEG
jgi:hypothetical protein